VVSDTAESLTLPGAGCLRVGVGLSEEEELLAVMIWLADSGVRRRECGRAAREWAAREMDLAAIGARYWAVCGL
jgi:hypothetical protein